MIRAVLSRTLAAFFAVGLSLSIPANATAQGLSALARLLPEESILTDGHEGVDLRLALSQAVPFRVFTLADPWRVVVDFREVGFGDWPEAQTLGPIVTDIAAGAAPEAGWSRMVLTLEHPFAPEIAAMRTDEITGEALVEVRLVPVSPRIFRANAGAPPVADPLPDAVAAAPVRRGTDPLVIVLDPGHGGVDPGAVRGPYTEADLVLTFARELRDALRRTGRVEVVLTREADVFVPLPTRITLARAAGADAFLSIHADALAEGRARGATVYTLSERASDSAAATLAAQHDRADLLVGTDLHGADDVIAGVLMELARLDTGPRGEALADQVVGAIAESGLRLHSRPRGEAGFTVLRAADIPSVLVEIGFMSDAHDLANIRDPEWRAQMQTALVAAILDWADADAARLDLARR